MMLFLYVSVCFSSETHISKRCSSSCHAPFTTWIALLRKFPRFLGGDLSFYQCFDACSKNHVQPHPCRKNGLRLYWPWLTLTYMRYDHPHLINLPFVWPEWGLYDTHKHIEYVGVRPVHNCTYIQYYLYMSVENMNWHNPEYAWTVTSNTWLSASGECFWYHAYVSKKAEIPNILQETANLSSWQCIHWRSYCWCSASGNILFPQWQHCRDLTSTFWSSKPWSLLATEVLLNSNQSTYTPKVMLHQQDPCSPLKRASTYYILCFREDPTLLWPKKNHRPSYRKTDMFNIFEFGIASVYMVRESWKILRTQRVRFHALDLAEKAFWILVMPSFMKKTSMKWATGALISLQTCQLTCAICCILD